MPKFSFKEKTGLSEVQWLQVFTAFLSIALYYSGLEALAIHSGAGATALLGILGAYMRNKDKRKSSAEIAASRLRADKHDTNK